MKVKIVSLLSMMFAFQSHAQHMVKIEDPDTLKQVQHVIFEFLENNIADIHLHDLEKFKQDQSKQIFYSNLFSVDIHQIRLDQSPIFRDFLNDAWGDTTLPSRSGKTKIAFISKPLEKCKTGAYHLVISPMVKYKGNIYCRMFLRIKAEEVSYLGELYFALNNKMCIVKTGFLDSIID